MKKTYKNPTLKVVKIQPNQLMIAASGETEATSGNLGRRGRFSTWEEEDFDE